MSIFCFAGKSAVLQIDSNGCISSLRLKNGTELVGRPIPLIVAELQDGSQLISEKITDSGSGFLCSDWGLRGKIELKIDVQKDYFRFVLQKISISGLKLLRYCQIAPACKKYIGQMGGMFSDDVNMVCLRSLSLKGSVEIPVSDPILSAYAEAEWAGGDTACALVAAPRDRIIEILQNMTENEAVPKSVSGGAWALRSEIARGSYVFADLRSKDTEQWIKLARRGYFSFIHLHAWWHTLGHYEVNRNFYPDGIADMKKAVDKIHAAGLKASFHTLTACIEPDDSWVTPVPADDLIASARYTLSRPTDEKDEVIYVHEKPADIHDLVWSYSSNGNAIKIGQEIIQYQEISREEPYCFKKCIRGAFGTSASKHAQDAEAAYLQQRYLAFYPEPDGKTADALADAITDTYKYLNLDGMYYDGSEGMRSRYGTDVMRWKIFQRLPENAVIEASNWNHNDWWFHTRLGAWDHASWAVKRSHEAHVDRIGTVPAADLLVPQMGWWAARGAVPGCRGQFIDELEYFAMKNLSIDAPMSLQELKASGAQWNERIFDMLTLLGWYERFRLARYFRGEDLQSLRTRDAEFNLRMNAKGVWQLLPLQVQKLRLDEISSGMDWNFHNTHAVQPFKARLEALYAVDDRSAGFRLTDFSNAGSINSHDSAKSLSFTTDIVKPDAAVPLHKLRIKAVNHGRVSNGAWAAAGMHFPYPYLSAHGSDAFVVWVKGDGSGALLNFQFRSPKQYFGAVSDHYVKLDFTGWKYCRILFRERDTESMPDFKWPYSNSAGDQSKSRSPLDRDHIEFIHLYLNCIPVHSAVDIEVSDLTAFPQEKVILSDIALQLNSTTLQIPAAMQSGDYLELDGTGSGSHYTEQGQLLKRFELLPAQVCHGSNAFRLMASASDGRTARMEFTWFTQGEAFGRRSKQINWDHLKSEYELPRIILSEDGRDNVWQIGRRDEKGHSTNDIPVLDFELETVSAGIAAGANRIQIDLCRDPEEYKVGPENHYERYLFDSENASTAKALVTYQLTTGRGCLKGSQNTLRFEAVSARGGDNMGWAAIGKCFALPLDLSGREALGIWLRSSANFASLKLQLTDVDGKSFELEIPLNNSAWHYTELPMENTGIDLSRITCIIYTISNIMAMDRVWVEMEEVVAVDHCSRLENPVLTINGKSVEFPCKLKTGDTLSCSDQQNFMVRNRAGELISSGKIQGAFPALKAGFNPARLNFRSRSSDNFQVIAKIIKNYA